MSFSKRSDSTPVCCTKAIDSLKNWNDHFFWVDSFACPAIYPWHTAKTVFKDPPPKPTDFNVDHYSTLVAHPAPFRDNHNADTYLSFRDNHNAEMDLTTFIRVMDPTKVKVVEKGRAENEPRLLETTVGRVVPLLPIDAAHSKDALEASVDKLFDEGGSGNQGDSATGGDGNNVLTRAGIENIATEPVTAKKPTRPRKKRPAATDAGGSTLPTKRVGEDYGASFSSATGGKSPSVIKELLEMSVLNAEIGVAAVATLPFVTSSVSASPERETADFTDVITRPNVRTIGPSERFTISSDSSHHSSNNASEAKTDYVIRFSDPPVMTEAVITTEETDVSSHLFLPITVDTTSKIGPDTFLDSSSAETLKPDVAGASQRPVLFSQIRALDYHQLFTEYNVGTARQACLNAEVRMRTKYNLSERKRLEDKCRKQTNLLRSKDDEIDILKVELLRKDVEAAEAKNAHASEVSLLRQQKTTFEYEKEILNKRVAELQSLSARREQELVHALEKSCSTLHNQLDTDLLNLVLHLDKEFYPCFLTAIAGRRWMLSRGMRLVVANCLQSPEYLTTLGAAIIRLIEKGMQDGLAAGIDHGKAGRTLGAVAPYNPSTESDYVTALRALQDVDFSLLSDLYSLRDASIQDVMDKLLLEGHVFDLLRLFQPDVDQLTLLNHRPEDQVVIGETSLSFSLNVVHARVEKIKGDAAGGSLSIHDALVLLADPLSAKNLTGVASSSGTAPPNAVGTTALSTVVVSTNTAPPITMDEYDIQGADNQERSREKGESSVAGMVEVEFEKEELDTTL
ncbi:hypothetical protein Tco_0702872 [Tanacetum coccineum]|uniref:Transposase (Putative), gypsy type n=1 Tax=Tanacetum coccineum TaxID=301880 RepID=A0ABQ4XXS8_9ASTR